MKDIDLVLRSTENVPHELRDVATVDLNHWFEFEIGAPSSLSHDAAIGGIRHPAHALMDSRTFERFPIDVGVGEYADEEMELLRASDLLSFSGIEPIRIPCFPLDRQLAEKVHAYTRIHEDRRSSRVKDLVDILLIADFSVINGALFREALEETFGGRSTHPLPNRFPDPPTDWSGPFRRLGP